MTSPNPSPEKQGEYLSVLSNVPADRIKPFVDSILPELGDIHVLQNRTGLVMLPYTDTVQGTVFHLGEVLVAEAHVQIDGHDGYGACMGRDLVQALAIAVLDAALQAERMTEPIWGFIRGEEARQQQAEQALLRQVEATRVEMETF